MCHGAGRIGLIPENLVTGWRVTGAVAAKPPLRAVSKARCPPRYTRPRRPLWGALPRLKRECRPVGCVCCLAGRWPPRHSALKSEWCTAVACGEGSRLKRDPSPGHPGHGPAGTPQLCGVPIRHGCQARVASVVATETGVWRPAGLRGLHPTASRQTWPVDCTHEQMPCLRSHQLPQGDRARPRRRNEPPGPVRLRWLRHGLHRSAGLERSGSCGWRIHAAGRIDCVTPQGLRARLTTGAGRDLLSQSALHPSLIALDGDVDTAASAEILPTFKPLPLVDHAAHGCRRES